MRSIKMQKIIAPFIAIVFFLFASNVWADCSSEVYNYDSGEYLYNTDAQNRCEEAVEEACSEGFRKCRNECNNDACEDACRAGRSACENSI